MALTSYTTLKNEIESYLNRTDLTANLDTFIDLAESRMARDLRLREMETIDTSITTVSGTQSLMIYQQVILRCDMLLYKQALIHF